MKEYLGLFAIWFAGFFLAISRFGFHSDYVLSVPDLLIFLLLAAPVLILFSLRWERGAKNERATLFFLILFSVSLRLTAPLNDGTSTFVAFADPIYNFQLTTLYSDYGHWVWGLQTGLAVNMLFTPMLHFLSVAFSNITGIGLYSVCRFFPPILFTIVTLFLFYCTFKRLLGSQKALLACFVFSLCYKFNFFTSLYLPESLGIIFFAMALYGLVSMRSEKDPGGRKFAVIFIIGSSLLVTTHFFSSFIFLVAITVGLMAGKLLKFSNMTNKPISATDVGVFAVLLYSWLLFVAYHLFVVQTRYISNFFNELVNIILNPAVSRSVEGIQEAGLSFWQSTIAYGGIVVLMLFGLITCLELFIVRRKTLGMSPYWRRVFAAIFFVVAGVTTVGLFAIVQSHDVAYRFFTFMYVFLAPTAAISLGTLLIPERSPRAGKNYRGKLIGRSGIRVTVVMLLIVQVISTGLLFPPNIASPIEYDDQESIIVSEWLSSSVDQSSNVIGDITLGTPITALARVGFWEGGAPAYMAEYMKVMDALYFGSDIDYVFRYLRSQNTTTYLLFDKFFFDHNHYLHQASTRSKPPSFEAMSSALQALDSSTYLNRIYHGHAAIIYILSE